MTYLRAKGLRQQEAYEMRRPLKWKEAQKE